MGQCPAAAPLEDRSFCSLAVAADFGLDLVTLSHAFVMSRPFVTSSIMGATNLEQLEAALDAVNVGIPEGLMQALDKVHQDYTYLCP